MGAVYFVTRARGSRLSVVWASGIGLVAALALDLTTGQQIALRIADPVATAPTFNLGAIFSLALPLLALTLSSQYAAGYAVLRAAGYQPNMDRVLIVTGGISALFAPLGCPGINLAAVTASLATGPEAHPDLTKRYRAGIVAGVGYVAIALLGVSALDVFAVMPKEFVAAITGLALFGTIITAASNALHEPRSRDAAGAAFLCAAGGFTLFHVGAPFWALVAGLAVSALPRREPA
jgi:benzoate membrane transport protein